jgi:hypothetical protein
MPRFYFDAEDRESTSKDSTGSEFPDDKAALDDARAAARQLAAEQLKFNRPIMGRAIVVRDEGGNVLHRFPVDAD